MPYPSSESAHVVSHACLPPQPDKASLSGQCGVHYTLPPDTPGAGVPAPGGVDSQQSTLLCVGG